MVALKIHRGHLALAVGVVLKIAGEGLLVTADIFAGLLAANTEELVQVGRGDAPFPVGDQLDQPVTPLYIRLLHATSLLAFGLVALAKTPAARALQTKPPMVACRAPGTGKPLSRHARPRHSHAQRLKAVRSAPARGCFTAPLLQRATLAQTRSRLRVLNSRHGIYTV